MLLVKCRIRFIENGKTAVSLNDLKIPLDDAIDIQHEIERTFDRYWKSTESKLDLIASLPIDLVLVLFFKRQGCEYIYIMPIANAIQSVIADDLEM